MSDRERWEIGIAAVREEFASLSPGVRSRVEEFAAALKLRKKELQSLAEEAHAGEICAACRGECCARGKNHFTVVDLLVYLADGRELFVPRFGGELCPYLGEDGCLMPPEYRPYNCISFICERVDGLLEPAAHARFCALEEELRAVYEEIERLFDNRFRGGLLGNCERDVEQKRIPILRGAAVAKTAEQACCK